MSLEFKEVLPDQCPPSGAIIEALGNVCRFLRFSPPESAKNYMSHAELGLKTGNASECDARSCSLFHFNNVARQAMKIPAFRNLKVAVLNVPKGAGAHVAGGNGHVNFWMTKDFAHAKMVVHVCNHADEVIEALRNA